MENICYSIFVERNLVGHCVYDYQIREKGNIPEEIKKSLKKLAVEQSKKTEKDFCLVLKME